MEVGVEGLKSERRGVGNEQRVLKEAVETTGFCGREGGTLKDRDVSLPALRDERCTRGRDTPFSLLLLVVLLALLSSVLLVVLLVVDTGRLVLLVFSNQVL